MIATLLVLAACSSKQGPPVAPATSSTLPAVEPLLCSRFEPPPIRTIDGHFYDVGKRCEDPGGKKRWITAFYQCTDGTVWPLLATDPGVTPPDPTGPIFDRCMGRAPASQ